MFFLLLLLEMSNLGKHFSGEVGMNFGPVPNTKGGVRYSQKLDRDCTFELEKEDVFTQVKF